mmetsp:Transcript_69796/g.151839  ORF Transcript_69796/g.151839 Transcript_69796/m.151839 type:complete len:646 (-) Transcript_69796:161-2098(-)
MGNSTSCSRLDCGLVVEDCANSLSGQHVSRKPQSLWYDCAGQPYPKAGGSAGSRAEGDALEVITPQEPEVFLTPERFAIARQNGSGPGNHSHWQRRYLLGRELGAGQTAVVFEAFAMSPGESARGMAEADTATNGRRVALKRFNSPRTTMFRQEVKALMAVGVHPHVLRLLEIFEGGGENDDALVLEYCEGGDVYELYAANNGCGMLETFVAHLVRQILLALDHLVTCNVEHRDVKPENLLLYGGSEGSIPHVKLADFGWAVVCGPDTKPPPVPLDGVGSLWYAPPELNPPVPGAEQLCGAVIPGRSDMWSIGVITYLLLVGHSPFNLALHIQDASARENEVIRLAAMGMVNKRARAWSRISEEARTFILALTRPEASKRPVPSEAQFHPWLVQNLGDIRAPSPSVPSPLKANRFSWSSLDGFQRLCWLAAARAITESELVEARGYFCGQPAGGCPSSASSGAAFAHLHWLAADMASAAAPNWFEADSSWADVLWLAFLYLDVDADGLLGRDDLVRHTAGTQSAQDVVATWLVRWRRPCEGAVEPEMWKLGLSFVEFHWALWSSCPSSGRTAPAMDISEHGHNSMDGDSEQFSKWIDKGIVVDGGNGLNSMNESAPENELLLRMQAIEAVCENYVDDDIFAEVMR